MRRRLRDPGLGVGREPAPVATIASWKASLTAAVRDGEPNNRSAFVSFSVNSSSGSPVVVSHNVPRR
jgi:hypothetical protein